MHQHLRSMSWDAAAVSVMCAATGADVKEAERFYLPRRGPDDELPITQVGSNLPGSKVAKAVLKLGNVSTARGAAVDQPGPVRDWLEKSIRRAFPSSTATTTARRLHDVAWSMSALARLDPTVVTVAEQLSRIANKR